MRIKLPMAITPQEKLNFMQRGTTKKLLPHLAEGWYISSIQSCEDGFYIIISK